VTKTNNKIALTCRKDECQRAHARERIRESRKTDIRYKLIRKYKNRIRKKVRDIIKEKYGTGYSILLGCSTAEFKSYIENQFKRGMSWDNYSLEGWHLDHIMPLASFNLENPEEVKKAFHFTNYQPLWAQENLYKSDSIPLLPKNDQVQSDIHFHQRDI
jgi:hypothetical protein